MNDTIREGTTIGAAPTLDVPTLAAALDNVDREYERGWTPAHYARAIAAEYDRLLDGAHRECRDENAVAKGIREIRKALRA